jgi:hypothetical protein
METSYSSKKETQNTQTLDEKHHDMMQIYDAIEQETLPNLKSEINSLISDAKQLKNGKRSEKYYELLDTIKAKKEEFKRLQNSKKKYLLENSKYVFDYYEDKQKISCGENVKDTNTINDFFRIKGKNEESSSLNTEKYKNSKKIYQQYWKNVGVGENMQLQDYVMDIETCLYCKQGELVPLEEEGVLICNNVACGKFIVHIIESQKPLNKEMPNEVSYTAYIRLNHFKEILSQFQAKETTKIPDEVLDAVKQRIKKERKNVKDLNYIEMRNILSILGYNKYFEHIQYINSILGIKPPIMSEELIETLCVLFIEIQQPWAIFCPITRTNFFNYTYILCQLCVLLDQKQYLPFIPMMKDRIKQLEQDMIWKKVCDYLDWEYFPTV